MRTGIRMVAAGLAIAGIGLVAACGGSGDSSGTSSGAAASDFVTQANGVCATAYADFQTLGDMQSFTSLADFKDRFGKALALAKKQYADIEILTPPAGISKDVATYLKEGATSVATSQRLYREVASGTDLNQAVADTTDSAAGRANIKARRAAAIAAGLGDCAS